jgi:hypothetical protein
MPHPTGGSLIRGLVLLGYAEAHGGLFDGSFRVGDQIARRPGDECFEVPDQLLGERLQRQRLLVVGRRVLSSCPERFPSTVAKFPACPCLVPRPSGTIRLLLLPFARS